MTTTAIRTEGLSRLGLLGRLKIRGRILAGFGVLLLLLAASVGITLVNVPEIREEGHFLTDLLLPNSTSLDEIRYRVASAEAALRDIVLYQSDNARSEHDRHWRELDKEVRMLDQFVAGWSSAEQIREWETLKRKLNTLHRLQEDLEAALTSGAADHETIEARLRDQVWPANRDVMLTLAGEINPATERREGGLITQRDDLTFATGADIAHRVHLLVGIEIAILGLGLGLTIVIALLTARSVTRPVLGLVGAVGKIAGGDAKVEVAGLERSDEVGELARAIDVIRDSGVKATRIKVGLDSVSANAMMSDNDGTIVYLNKAVTEMLRRAEADIRRELPGFDTSRLLGANIDLFHRDPAHQRALLSRLTGAHRARIRIGGRSFDLVANPVVNDKGERLGSVVEWKDITQELKVEEEIAELVQGAASGDFTRRIDPAGKDGFMLKLAEGMNRLTATTLEALETVVDFLAALAKGDLTKRIDGTYHGMFERIKNDANATADQLGGIVSRIIEAGEIIRAASGEISAGSADLSARTEQQASSLQQTAASMEELAATVRQNSENAQQANQLAAGTRDAAETGGKVAGDAIQAMNRIEDSSQKIADIIGVIDEIAFQTNLLALNASVEAARAGDAGKGFAVVASEVRALAQRSAQASKEIKALIADSGSQVKDGVGLVRKAGSALTEIVTSVKRVADIVAEIAAASAEQASGLEQVNIAVAQMDEMTQKNAALVEQSAAAARSLDDQAVELGDMTAFFTISAGRRDAGGGERRPARPAERPEATARAPPAAPERRDDTKPPSAKRPAAAAPRSRAAAGAKKDDGWHEF